MNQKNLTLNSEGFNDRAPMQTFKGYQNQDTTPVAGGSGSDRAEFIDNFRRATMSAVDYQKLVEQE